MFPASILQGTYNQSSGGIDPITAPATGTFFGFRAENGASTDVIFTSSNNQTPVEAKRLYSTSNTPDVDSSIQGYFTGSLQVGTILYSNSGKTTTLASTWGNSYMTNDYAQFAMLPNGSNWFNLGASDPANFYWISIQKSNSTVTAITENANVTANTLKDISSTTTGTPPSSHGAFVLASAAYTSYSNALAAAINSGSNFDLFFDGPSTYPKKYDRTYVSSTGLASSIWGTGVVGGWFAFTKSGTAIDYAVKFDYASYNGQGVGALPSNSNLWITEIRNSSGTEVNEIT